MANDAEAKYQVGRLLTLTRAHAHGCMLKSASRGAPCTECVRVGNTLRERVEAMLRLSYMRGHDDQRQGRMQEPERGVMEAVAAFREHLR